MKKYLTLLAMMMLPMTILAQETTDSLFKGKFKNAEQGQINGCWMFLKVKDINEDTAVVRVVSEKGSDAQDLKLKVTAESLEIQQEDGYIKGIKGNKYVKLPKTLVFTRQ